MAGFSEIGALNDHHRLVGSVGVRDCNHPTAGCLVQVRIQCPLQVEIPYPGPQGARLAFNDSVERELPGLLERVPIRVGEAALEAERLVLVQVLPGRAVLASPARHHGAAALIALKDVP